MILNDLYELENEVYKNISRIKREQEEYLKGVEEGINLMFKAVRNYLAKEEEETVKAVRHGCGDCENRNTTHCNTCVTSDNPKSTFYARPSHWRPLPEPPKESEGAE